MSPAGLKTRRSGGNANRSLTTWLNVPVVRRNVRVKFERSHKISHCSTSVGIWRVSVLFVLLSVLKNASEVARRALFASGFADDRRRTTDDGFPESAGEHGDPRWRICSFRTNFRFQTRV